MADTPQTIVITGASDGIGAVAARELAAAGHHVVMVGRSPEKTYAVARAAGIADVHLADFSRLDEVRRLADEVRERYPRIDVLANNAGGIFTGPTRTDDGFEKTFQVNHLAPFLLTHHLIDRLLDSRALVVNTASIAARMFSALDLDDLNTWTRFTPNRAYGNAKLAGILFARGLTTHYAARGLTAISFHPGVVATSFASDTTSPLRWLYHTVMKGFLVSPEQGGENLRRFLDPAHRDDWRSGTYYDPAGRQSRTTPVAGDLRVIDEHWRRSSAMLGLTWP
ncbi:MAG TPA: SDR family NAD(P)-dependent oxidoreductase [Propioniciclava sp.]|uniref:SDR family NAD(P)-dependent oxidoreductase n=1 Tax=Propioniciclava sp. TaxID=2038686 RepID=UPI002C959508|nr:SDR family NAD(P)-dependent oxidoreductase [Propioniciclava sp.]HRL48281.1 SDR family NAD(P)-dependent oxidoreductase [Propioniciclava sp.]